MWYNIEQLKEDIQKTEHVEGVAAALEVQHYCMYIYICFNVTILQLCCTILVDDIELATEAMDALHRLGKGKPDKYDFNHYTTNLIMIAVF